MEAWFAASAFKHGITEEQIRHVIAYWHPPFIVTSASAPGSDVSLYVGEDARGRLLEVIGIEEEDEFSPGEWGLHIFHAMDLRRSYRPYYEEQLRWRGVE